jgi:hypothetical protein
MTVEQDIASFEDRRAFDGAQTRGECPRMLRAGDST